MDNSENNNNVLTIYDSEHDKHYVLQLNMEDYQKAMTDESFAASLLFHAQCNDEKRKPVATSETSLDNGEGNSSQTETTKIWSHSNILLLIELYKEYQEQFDSNLKKVVWQKLAADLSKRLHVTITGQQCDTKWKGLLATYKQVKDHNNKSGNNSKHWQYFNILNEILYLKPEITPLATCSIREGLVVRSDVMNQNIIRTESPSTSRSCSSPECDEPTPRRRRLNPIDQRHKERIERQDRFLNLLERMTVVMEKSVSPQ